MVYPPVQQLEVLVQPTGPLKAKKTSVLGQIFIATLLLRGGDGLSVIDVFGQLVDICLLTCIKMYVASSPFPLYSRGLHN